ncbi:MAG: succinate dehydrogenase [Trueperaceae bacterium]|jgi:succinate dehydrogenase / fumarate reductase membrane anchor subunit|nr:succinate dehydrogenase [Trueperaceae bacterium]MCH2667697.1 succinate dehydrogenase hydrophobic membrane anchor subunit [Deinococcales bacterium]
MSNRPKTLQQARATYSTNSEIFWWVFMRISGLALVFLVFGHLFFNNIQINVSDVDYNYVASRFSKSWVKIYDSFLLGFAMLHGINGLRYSIEDYVKSPSRRFWAKIALFTIAGIVLVLGVITLWAFTFEEMGDAIRALPGD